MKRDTLIASDGDSENESNSSFDHFLISNPKLQRYDKSYGMHYDSVNDQLKVSDIPVTFDYGNLHLLDNYYPWTKGLCSSEKRRNIINDSAISNEPFDFSSLTNSPKFEEPPIDQLFKFSLSPTVKKGSGLYKDLIPHTQLVYYDDPNELDDRLNLLTSSRNAGNTECIDNELHRHARKVFPRRSIITRFKDDHWQADLMDMQSHSKQNLGF
ncbi:TRPL translocation defect protein 14-like, partial [Aphis craccivora]